MTNRAVCFCLSFCCLIRLRKVGRWQFAFGDWLRWVAHFEEHGNGRVTRLCLVLESAF
jgi:hypothetical protein